MKTTSHEHNHVAKRHTIAQLPETDNMHRETMWQTSWSAWDHDVTNLVIWCNRVQGIGYISQCLCRESRRTFITFTCLSSLVTSTFSWHGYSYSNVDRASLYRGLSQTTWETREIDLWLSSLQLLRRNTLDHLRKSSLVTLMSLSHASLQLGTMWPCSWKSAATWPCWWLVAMKPWEMQFMWP